MEIPWRSLSKEVLLNLVDEIVTRDGTDYGDIEKSREQKINQLMTALESGKATIYWDADSETASIKEKD